MLKGLHPFMLRKLARRCQIQEFKTHDVVYREGEPADKMFVIIEGQVGINEERNGELVEVNILSEGLAFGEVGFDTTGKRSSTVLCLTPCSLAIIDHQLYREVTYVERQKQIRLLTDWLTEKVPLAQGLSVRKILSLAHQLTLHPVKPGQIVYCEGDRAEMIYVVKRGTCIAHKRFTFAQEHRWPTKHDEWQSDERRI